MAGNRVIRGRRAVDGRTVASTATSIVALLVFLLSASGVTPATPSASAAAASQIMYRLSVPQPRSQMLHVEAEFSGTGPSTDLYLANWAPGFYGLQWYGYYLDPVRAETQEGAPLTVTRTGRYRWRIHHADGPFRVRYRVRCEGLESYGNWVGDEFMFVNPIATLLVPVGARTVDVELRLKLPKRWKKGVVSPLKTARAGDTISLWARTIDELFDSPIAAGQPEVKEFRALDRTHRLAVFGAEPGWDHDRAARDAKKVVETIGRFWGNPPYDEFVFLNVHRGPHQALEHLDSTLMLGTVDMAKASSYQRWLGLLAHEHFHSWNAKALRPRPLVDLDYEQFPVVDSLWLVEGATHYYATLLIRRAGLIDDKELLRRLTRFSRPAHEAPMRRTRSLVETSRNSWAREESRAFYTTGAALAWLLDTRIQGATRGRRSLDDVMRRLYRDFEATGYTHADVESVVAEVSGSPAVGRWLRDAAHSTGPLDFRPALQRFGLKWKSRGPSPRPWAGVELSGDRKVKEIAAEGPGREAGFQIEDEIIAVNGKRVRDRDWLSGQTAGHPVTVLIAREGSIKTLSVPVGARPPASDLEFVERPSRSQKRARRTWLRPR